MTLHRLLVVDGDEARLEAFAQTLRDRLVNTEVAACSSAERAVEKLAEVDYEVVLADIELPDANGPAFLERLRAVRPETPLLMMTAERQHELAVEALQLGAFDFLDKPIDLERLSASIARALRFREVAARLEDKRAGLERHAAELAHIVEDQTRELREANQIKDEFLATLSHELRTPLTSMLGWARLLLRGRLDEAMKAEAIESIERNASLQAHLIEDLLDVSRIMTGKLRLMVRPVPVAGILAAAVDAVAASARAKRIRVVRTIDPGSGRVSGDPDRLQQVFVNLLSNAIKFTPDGGLVEITLAHEERHTLVTVRDTGVGISPDFLPQVFERFRQADSSLARSRGGLGLGLAIVRHLVELHGGEARADSPGLGSGATFSVKLPCLTEVPKRDSGSLKEPPRQDPLRLDGVRVLVVEDDTDARTFIRAALERYGALVTAVDSGARAMDALDRSSMDVLLCDIGMPQEDGYALIRRIRARSPDGGGRIRAAALTAYARAEDIRHALSEGFDMHLAKPIEPAEIASAVADLTAQR
jgi:signal transduction histidine kinase